MSSSMSGQPGGLGLQGQGQGHGQGQEDYREGFYREEREKTGSTEEDESSAGITETMLDHHRRLHQHPPHHHNRRLLLPPTTISRPGSGNFASFRALTPSTRLSSLVMLVVSGALGLLGPLRDSIAIVCTTSHWEAGEGGEDFRVLEMGF